MCSKQKAPPPPKFSDPRQNDPKYQEVGRSVGISSISNADQLYQIEKTISQQQQAKYDSDIKAVEQRAAEQRAADIQRSESQFASSQQAQQDQFAQAQAAQERALQAQLTAQAEMQRRAEEAALRAQVPEMTGTSKDARRIKSKTSSRQQSRQASLGTSQLRIPLSIGSAMGSGSPVKLNIGS